ncbi:MBL fold metallo-hydrolase [Bacteroidota bacterium]
MKKIKVKDNLYQYHFTDSNSDYSNSITILIEGKEALFFDTAYKRHSEKVLSELHHKGVDNFTVLLSHHHEDHFGGITCFDNSCIYGADNFGDDQQDHLDDEYLINFRPANHFSDWEPLEIAGHKIHPIYTPGHNKCHYSFLIDNQIVYAGDLIYYNKANKPCIPYIDENSWIHQHIESLVKIKRLGPKILIVGHGYHIEGAEKISDEIDDRLFYLEKLYESCGRSKLEDSLKMDISKYGGLNFHEMNLKRIQSG